MLAKIKIFLSKAWTTIRTQIADIWNRTKIFILAIAALIIAFEWQKLKAYLLVKSGQQEMKKDNAEDQTLAAKETQANNAANALVQKSSQESANDKPITDDWNKS